jgi:hypothetical protein
VALLPSAIAEVAVQHPEMEVLALSVTTLTLASVEGPLEALLICELAMERAGEFVALTVRCSGKAEMGRWGWAARP